jgi:peptidyl-Lys metalloendopeptidase
MRWIVIMLALAALPGAASALDFRRCDKAQIAYATAAVRGAQDLARMAGAAVGDTPTYRRWFGTFTAENGEKVRASLKAVDRALGRDELTLFCPASGESGCAVDTYANVLPNRPYFVNLCAAFFTQPTMGGVVATSAAFDSGTREGTIIHEVSHFDIVAGTDDHCYTRSICSEYAKTDPARAIDNADSLQYFAEDVVLGPQGRLAD